MHNILLYVNSLVRRGTGPLFPIVFGYKSRDQNRKKRFQKNNKQQEKKSMRTHTNIWQFYTFLFVVTSREFPWGDKQECVYHNTEAITKFPLLVDYFILLLVFSHIHFFMHRSNIIALGRRVVEGGLILPTVIVFFGH